MTLYTAKSFQINMSFESIDFDKILVMHKQKIPYFSDKKDDMVLLVKGYAS